MFSRTVLYRIQVLSGHGQTEICDSCMVIRDVHDDIRLSECQYGGEMKFKITTYSLEIPMNQTVGVEVVEAFRNVK